LAANAGSREILKVPLRWGFNSLARHSSAMKCQETVMFSDRLKYPAIVRDDQCDNPVAGGGVVRVNARIRAFTAAGTCSRGAACDRSPKPATPLSA
jgi:hypothetical protein